MQTVMTTRDDRGNTLRKILFWCFVILSAKGLLGILYEYQWYFPADYDASAYLSGRRYAFDGFQKSAFYWHVISSPIALIVGTFLISSGGRGKWMRWHRLAGRFQAANVLLLVVPSGIAMALNAYAGPIAATGFALWGIATGVTMLLAVWNAVRRNFHNHRLWAMRCYLLLWAPLLLRLLAGAAIVTGFESEWTYRLNAWVSWIVPLIVFENRFRIAGFGNRHFFPDSSAEFDSPSSAQNKRLAESN